MAEETPTNPSPSFRSSSGVVASAGKEPIHVLMDLNGDGVPDYQQKWFRDALANGAYWLIGRIFPGAAQSMVLKQTEPHVRAIIQTGAK